MKATAHWLELKGHTPRSPSMHFDIEFTEQVVARGRIEDVEVLKGFYKRTGQPLWQDWLVAIGWRLAKRLPVKWGIKSALALVFKPRTRRWGQARRAVEDYIHAREEANKLALHIDRPTNGPVAANKNGAARQLSAAE
jgi:heterodisulfide reductase subunit C